MVTASGDSGGGVYGWGQGEEKKPCSQLTLYSLYFLIFKLHMHIVTWTKRFKKSICHHYILSPLVLSASQET